MYQLIVPQQKPVLFKYPMLLTAFADTSIARKTNLNALIRFLFFFLLTDQQDARPQELPLPRLSSTPSKSTPRKRVVTSTVTTRQQTRQDYSEGTGNSVKQTDSVEIMSVKKISPPAKEEKSICGPHIQILLAVVVFVVFTVFLIYHLMEEGHNELIVDQNNPGH